MAIGTTPGDVLACAILDPNAPGVEPGSVGVLSVVPDSPTSVLVTLSAPVDASGVAVLAAMDGDPANVRAVSVEPTGSPSVWRVSWASAGGGGVTAVTASAPVTSSGGAAPNVALVPGVNNGDVLTWTGAQWVSAAPFVPPPASVVRTYPINVSHNNASVLWGPSVWLDFGFDPVTSAARFYLPTLGDEGRLILSANRVTTVAEFVTPVAGAPGLYDATFASGVSVLAPGWYVFGVRKTAGPGTVDCLGLYLT